MIETKTEIIEEYVKKHAKVTLEKVICDWCKKDIPFNNEFSWLKEEKFKCYEVVTGHHDWGNDSCESIEYHQFCCTECLTKFLEEYYKDASDTAYSDIKIEFYYKGKEY